MEVLWLTQNINYAWQCLDIVTKELKYFQRDIHYVLTKRLIDHIRWAILLITKISYSYKHRIIRNTYSFADHFLVHSQPILAKNDESFI